MTGKVSHGLAAGLPRCFDERCEVKSSCLFWLDRHNPKAKSTIKTLRQISEFHSVPCAVSQEYFGDDWLSGGLPKDLNGSKP